MKQGKLEHRPGVGTVIVEREIDVLQPREIVYTWPIPAAANFPDGADCYYASDGAYRIRDGFGILRTVYMPNNGATKAISIDYVPIPPPPRVRSEVRWQSGRWQKYDKRRGWIAC